MRISCPFCKVEYSVNPPCGTVSCTCCGHVWTPAGRQKKGSFLVFFASICALLAAAAFAISIIIYKPTKESDAPLVARIDSVRTITDAFGTNHLAVNGTVENRSDKIFGVPDIVIILKDENDEVIATQKFMPPATLLDSGESVEFSHTLAES